MIWILVFGFILSVGSSIPNVMQLLRSSRVRNAYGWNPQLVCAWLISYIAWGIYAGIMNEPMLVFVNFLGALTMSVILLFLAKEGKVNKIHSIGWGAWGISVVLLGVIWLPALLPILVTAVDIIVMFPQVLSLLKANNADGMSMLYFSLGIVLGVGWIIYSFLVGKPLLGLYHWFGVPWSVWVLWRIRELRSNRVIPHYLG